MWTKREWWRKTNQHERHCTPFAKIGSGIYYITLHRYSFGILEPLLLCRCNWELAIALSQLSFANIRTQNQAPAQPYISKTNFANSSKCGCELFRLSPSLYLSLGVYECVCLALYDFIWNLNVAICSDKKRLRISLTNKWTLHFIHIKCLTAAQSWNERARAHKHTHSNNEWTRTTKFKDPLIHSAELKLSHSVICDVLAFASTNLQCVKRFLNLIVCNFKYQRELLFTWLVFPIPISHSSSLFLIYRAIKW